MLLVYTKNADVRILSVFNYDGKVKIFVRPQKWTKTYTVYFHRKLANLMPFPFLQSKNSIFIALFLVTGRCQRVVGSHRRNLRQGVQCKVASVSICVNFTDSGFKFSLLRQFNSDE